jgi:hypothetical protein
MLGEKRLIQWLAATKSEEANAVAVQVDFGANETMRPTGIDGKTTA